MSIAVSALIRPSRVFTVMMVVVVLFGVIVAGIVLSYPYFLLSFALRVCIACIVILCTLVVCCRLFYLQGVSYLIDISDKGQIRVRVADAFVTDDANVNQFLQNTPVFVLQKHSTLWSQLLLLRLRSGEGKSLVLLIFKDSVSAESFRKLSVALRWIAVSCKTLDH